MEENGGSPGSVRVAKATTYRVGQQVRIRKEKMRFAKAAEQNFSTEIFRVAKVIDRRPRAVYELKNLMAKQSTASFVARK